MTEEEIDSLSLGSVLRYGPNGTLRIVRKVTRNPKTGRVRHVWCAKRKCSAYSDPFAPVNRYHLRHFCSVTGARVRLDTPADIALAEEWERCGRDRKIDQCDAKEFPA